MTRINIILHFSAAWLVRKICGLILLVSLLPGASAQLDVQIERASCPAGTNPLVSIDEPNATTGNPGGVQDGRNALGLYERKVCVGGVEAPTLRETCTGEPGFYLYSTGTDAHFSNKSVYRFEVCTGRLQINLRSLDTDGDGQVEQSNPCKPGEKQLFSVSNHTNGHIGSPYNDFYRFKACGLVRSFAPESVEIRLNVPSNRQVRSDGEQLEDAENKTSFENPYIASSPGGSSAVAAVVSRSLNKTIRRVGDENGRNSLVASMSIPEESPAVSAFVPHTRGGFDSLRSRREAVNNRELLETWDPTFGFPNPEERPTQSNYYQSYLISDFDLKTNMTLQPGSYRLQLEKTGENEVAVEMR